MIEVEVVDEIGEKVFDFLSFFGFFVRKWGGGLGVVGGDGGEGLLIGVEEIVALQHIGTEGVGIGGRCTEVVENLIGFVRSLFAADDEDFRGGQRAFDEVVVEKAHLVVVGIEGPIVVGEGDVVDAGEGEAIEVVEVVGEEVVGGVGMEEEDGDVVEERAFVVEFDVEGKGVFFHFSKGLVWVKSGR